MYIFLVLNFKIITIHTTNVLKQQNVPKVEKYEKIEFVLFNPKRMVEASITKSDITKLF